MKIQFAIIFLLSLNSHLWSQLDSNQVVVYEWEVAKFANPDTIYGISFAKLKLDQLPAELETFKKLRTLNLEKNKLTEIPDFIAEFKELEELNAGKNKLETFPVQICRMTSIKRLILNRNNIETIPDCIQYSSELRYIDLYDCPLKGLPNTLTELKHLEEIDLSGIRFSPVFQESWLKKLPNTKLVFDAPCDCMD